MTAPGRISDGDIERARAIGLRPLLDLSKFKAAGRIKTKLAGPCPFCSDGRDRFCIDLVRELFWCRICRMGGRGAIDFIRCRDGVEFVEAVERLAGPAVTGGSDSEPATVWHGKKNVADPHSFSVADDAAAAAERNRRLALAIWYEAAERERAPVEDYLHRRGLRPPSSDVIRFHPGCLFAGKRVPAMVALVRNIVTNAPQAIHRTALDLAGNKVKVAVGDDMLDRMALGPIGGGAIKLTDDAEVAKALGIGEGIESALSLQLLPQWFGSPVWAVLSANGIRDFPVLPGIETLFVAVDNDLPDKRGHRAGQEAATPVTRRWRDARREVLLAFPTAEDTDVNDVVRGARQ